MLADFLLGLEQCAVLREVVDTTEIRNCVPDERSKVAHIGSPFEIFSYKELLKSRNQIVIDGL